MIIFPVRSGLVSEGRYSVIGYACGLGGAIPGSEGGPRAIRNLLLIERLEKLGVTVRDLGDTSPPSPPQDEDRLTQALSSMEQMAKDVVPIFSACRELTKLVEHSLEDGMTPIILGGDHSFSIGSVAGACNYFAKKGEELGLLWIDAHPDINTPETSYSKRVYGMSVAVLLGLVPGLLSTLQWRNPALSPRHLVYIGLRDVDPPERELIRQLNIPAFTMKDIDIHGLAWVVRRAIEIASDGTAGCIASFDLDVCDPPLVPGIALPKRGGLTYREAELVWELLYDSKRLRSIEIVELNPLLDRDGITAELGVSLIESAIGKSIL